MLAIKAPQQALKQDFDLQAICACEIEFYLHGAAELSLEAFWQEISAGCAGASIRIEKEMGALSTDTWQRI